MSRARLMYVVAGAALLAGAWAAPAAAQYASADGLCVQTFNGGGTAQSTFQPGDTIIVKGIPSNSSQRCFDPGSQVRITLERGSSGREPLLGSVVFNVVTASSSGAYDTSSQGGATIPSETRPGTHTIRASGTCNSCGTGATDYTAAIKTKPDPSDPPGLPAAGRNIVLLTLWGLFLVVFGSVLVSVSWRRWQAAKVQALYGGLPDRHASRSSVAAALERRTSVPKPLVLQSGQPLPDVRPASTPAMPLRAEDRRRRAAELFQRGEKQADIARQLGVSRQSVSRWYRQWQQGDALARGRGKQAGRPPKLQAAQLKAIERALLRGPRANGYRSEHWTLKQAGEVIERTTGAAYSQGHVWRILQSMGWSVRRPAKRPPEPDDGKHSIGVVSRSD